ncbi:MAG TPA: pyridoxal phosphate-dependent aminotransferase [Candidatus Hydrogenedentes bacterium]|nr:pyridoxal phosphate-dependent aminotransferase [Candidatus Hydrogenedentota bacterium]
MTRTKGRTSVLNAESIVDIGKGEPDFHTPPHIKEAAHNAIDANFTKYTPQPGIPELRQAIARKFRTENGLSVVPGQIVVSCGGKHAVDNAVRALVRPGDEVVMVTPFWFAYPEQVRLCGGTPVFVSAREENRYVPDPDDVRAAISPKTRLVMLNSPNNPTGAVYPPVVLSELAALVVEHDLMVIADEVYEKVVFAGATHVSMASLNGDIAARTVTINSVSKTHAMTGWRIGYAAWPGDLAERVTAIQSVSTSAPSAISQRAALAAFEGDQAHVAAMVDAYAARRRFVLECIERMPALSAVPPAGTFYCFVSIEHLVGRTFQDKPLADADDVVRLWREALGVSVVSGTGFGAPRHVRMSFAVGLTALQEGLGRIERLLAE